MAAIVSEDVKRGIRQLREIEDRFLNGSLDPLKCRRPLQDIIEDRTTSITTTPSWYVPPEVQVSSVGFFLGKHSFGMEGFLPSDIPPVPEDFVPKSATEVLLLTVTLPPYRKEESGLQRTFDAWWDIINPPAGFTKAGRMERTDSLRLRSAPGFEYRYKPGGIRWVAFDPNTYLALSPEQALMSASFEGKILAGVEVLMAAAHFPDWVSSWNRKSNPYPNMSALQCFDTETHRWTKTPYLVTHVPAYDGADYELAQNISWYDNANENWASPSVREC